MAQSSNYKQYNRTTRVLTEESGFAGGMLWTGNNIDETHLKAIVNCDYDDTTGYLKTRDPFDRVNFSPSDEELEELFTPQNEGELRPKLKGYSLLCVQRICAFDFDSSDLLPAGDLYIFTKKPGVVTSDEIETASTEPAVVDVALSEDAVSTVNISYTDTVCIYHINKSYYYCELELEYGAVLRNIVPTNVLVNYDNYLYGLGQGLNSTEDTPWLQVYSLEYHSDEDKYYFRQNLKLDTLDKIDSVTLLEACVSGFNAAREDAFKYESTIANSDYEQRILGIYITDAVGNVVVSPRIDGDYTIHVPVSHVKTSATTKHTLAVFELKDSGDSTTLAADDIWSEIKTINTADDTFSFKFKFAKKTTTLAFTYFGIKTVTNPTAYSEDAVDYLIPYQITAGDNTSNLKLKNYDLSTSEGSCIWRNRLCVWGVPSNNNCLFLSEVDNFYYYPIPHNVAVFDTNIVSCIPYKDTLLVFTANKIYRMSENNDGTFTQTVVQNDMPLSREDAMHLTAIKNMVLFKSGNYFYMVVPKSQSLKDELSIAPIYKNIAGFLNTLDTSVREVLQLLYPEYRFGQCDILNKGKPTAVYSEQDTVHILYDISTSVGYVKEDSTPDGKLLQFKLFLNYNTNLRAWTLYLEDTTSASLETATLTASRLMSFVRINDSGLFSIVTQRPITDKQYAFRVLLDTGYRSLSTATQKRFREVQLKLHNASEAVTAFGTAFLVDGVWRRNYAKLQEVTVEATNGSNVTSLTPAIDINTFITELSMPVNDLGEVIKDPGSDAIELSDWTLDFSHFKREAPVTVRIPVSGKGFNPRFIFMIPDAVGVTINEINWVYRLMHGR